MSSLRAMLRHSHHDMNAFLHLLREHAICACCGRPACFLSRSMTYNLTIDDTSPLFQYKPYGTFLSSETLTLSPYYVHLGEGSHMSGWATFWTYPAFLTGHAFGDAASGTSYHVTQTNGASLALSFYGEPAI